MFFLNNKMFVKKYNEIMSKTERERSRWAFGMTVALTALIFVSFAFYRGYLSFGGSGTQVANVVSADLAPSPIENTKNVFGAAFGEIGQKYQEFKDSLANVFVPFITGIEVYQKK